MSNTEGRVDDEKMTLRERWNRGLNDLSVVVEKVYGPRCQRFEPTCVCCMGWAVFDQLEKFTDSSLLDEVDKTQGGLKIEAYDKHGTPLARPGPGEAMSK